MFKKMVIRTSDYGDEIQEDLNAIVGYDEKFNNAIVRHALDLKNEAIFRDVKKFDLVNPVIGKLATQVKAIKLTDHELTKKILGQGETDKLQNRFDLFKEGLSDIINKDNDSDKYMQWWYREREMGRRRWYSKTTAARRIWWKHSSRKF